MSSRTRVGQLRVGDRPPAFLGPHTKSSRLKSSLGASWLILVAVFSSVREILTYSNLSGTCPLPLYHTFDSIKLDELIEKEYHTIVPIQVVV